MQSYLTALYGVRHSLLILLTLGSMLYITVIYVHNYYIHELTDILC